MNAKLLTEHQLEFLSFKGGCTGSSESKLVKMPHCWKSPVTAHILIVGGNQDAYTLFRRFFLVDNVGARPENAPNGKYTFRLLDRS